jgi:hypothetical protein
MSVVDIEVELFGAGDFLAQVVTNGDQYCYIYGWGVSMSPGLDNKANQIIISSLIWHE